MTKLSPPLLQIALDIVLLSDLEKILSQIPLDKKIILEAGTPLIKKFGVSIINKIRENHPVCNRRGATLEPSAG